MTCAAGPWLQLYTCPFQLPEPLQISANKFHYNVQCSLSGRNSFQSFTSKCHHTKQPCASNSGMPACALLLEHCLKAADTDNCATSIACGGPPVCCSPKAVFKQVSNLDHLAQIQPMLGIFKQAFIVHKYIKASGTCTSALVLDMSLTKLTCLAGVPRRE